MDPHDVLKHSVSRACQPTPGGTATGKHGAQAERCVLAGAKMEREPLLLKRWLVSDDPRWLER